jgi:hypothetical protein
MISGVTGSLLAYILAREVRSDMSLLFISPVPWDEPAEKQVRSMNTGWSCLPWVVGGARIGLPLASGPECTSNS